VSQFMKDRFAAAMIVFQHAPPEYTHTHSQLYLVSGAYIACFLLYFLTHEGSINGGRMIDALYIAGALYRKKKTGALRLSLPILTIGAKQKTRRDGRRRLYTDIVLRERFLL
jgi:hypothetical protein